MVKTIEMDGVTFHLDTRPGKERGKSTKNEFILVKHQSFLEFYDEIKDQGSPKDIMEVGMFEGGSLVYFDKLFQPECLVGLDIRKDPIEPLEEYCGDRDHIKTYYGRSQDKVGTLNAARSNFPTGIDLVVDDASHLYEQTKATFLMLFPLVRAGGTYIIEDWAWSHMPNYQGKLATWARQPAMTNLIFELIALAGRYGVIESIKITHELVAIKKGAGTLPEDGLGLSQVLRGKKLSKI